MQVTATAPETTVLVGVVGPGEVRAETLDSLTELAELVDTAGGQVLETLAFRPSRINSSTLVGRGQVNEIAATAARLDVDLVVFDEDLAPAQQRNLERALERRVIDRTGLILDIFARRARTREGKLQVELAQLEYRLPRLTRLWTHLSRLGGGIGTRGPGETQLEMDRRVIRERIQRVRREIEGVRRHRSLHRDARRSVPVPTVALVGYTNAGKSTLLTALTGAATLIEDKLFATLDPLTRRLRLPGGSVCLLTDTVGFIRKLPHQLVAAFKATLEELGDADVLLHVVDACHPRLEEHVEAVIGVLTEVGVIEKPRLVALNKIDLCPGLPPAAPARDDGPGPPVPISALTGRGLPELLAEIERLLGKTRRLMEVVLPLARGDLAARVAALGRVIEKEYCDDGLHLTAEVPPRLAGELLPFVVAPADGPAGESEPSLDTPTGSPNNACEEATS